MPAGQPGLFVLSVLEAFGLLRANGALLHPASTSEVSLGLLDSSLRQLKGPLARPELPIGGPVCKEKIWILATCALQTWQRPTLPRLETKYHQRWSVSRPSSEWDRVQPLRHNHQVGKAHVAREAVFFVPGVAVFGRSPQARPRVRAFARPCPEASAKPTAARANNHQATILWIAPTTILWIALVMGISNENDQADRTISTGKLQALPLFHTRPINVVVFHGSQGILVLRWVSRLDAFSGYPVRI